MNEPELISRILAHARTIAVVGLSPNPARPSYRVLAYMQRQGYRIVPVNPKLCSAAGSSSVLGQTAYPTLAEAASAGRIDLVDLFRASQFVAEIVEETIRLKIPWLWLQEGVCDERAARRAEAAGIGVVMDRCIYQEHAASGLSGPPAPAGSSCPV